MEKIDIAIIGGGIAGLSLAKFLAERGIPFILFEEHTDFFMKPCGEGITQKIAGYDFFDFYDSKKGIEKEIWETIIHTKYGKISLEMPVLMTDKKAIEEELAKKAIKQGEIKMGEKVDKIVNGILYPQEIKPKLIVGADGAFSITRKYIGVKPPHLGVAVDGYAKNVDYDADNCHVILDKQVVNYGYAWFFPKKDRWNIGVGSYKIKYFKQAFPRFKENYKAEKWKGAYIPLDKPTKSYGKNAILIGDSAAQIYSALGAGNMSSMIIANLAAELIEKFAKRDFRNMDLSLYEKKWKKVIGKYLRYSYLTTKIFFSIVKSEYLRYKLLQKMCKDTTQYYRKLMKK